MGITSPTPQQQLKSLYKIKGKFITNIDINKIKIDKLEEKISDYNSQIKEKDTEIMQYQYSLNEDEKLLKAKKVIILRNDRDREKGQLNNLYAFNETLKNNLDSVKNKIGELEMYINVKDANKILKQSGILDTNQTFIENAEIILEGRDKTGQIIKGLTNGNSCLNEGIQSPDDYLKSLLGNNETPKNNQNGGFYYLTIKIISL